MTTIQFIYMMGVLWLIFAGVIFQPDAEPSVNLLTQGVVYLGFAHIGLAGVMLGWGWLIG